MKILIFNCGSSSLKYKIIKMPDGQALAGGEAQRVGPKTSERSKIFHRVNGHEMIIEADMENHSIAFEKVMDIVSGNPALAPDAVGHRVVHGGDIFKDAAIISEENLKELEQINDMAPLHNPPAVALIKACCEKYPKLPQVAVFDTAYHASIPEYAKIYPLPIEFARKAGIKKYGFHGTSHQFVVEEAANFLKVPLNEFNAVSCHLGSGGASLCAVIKGKSADNTMGYSPLQGLVMSTRCGDLDPSVAMRLLSRAAGDGGEVEKLLNKESGVLGLSGVSGDIRDILNGQSAKGKGQANLERTEEIYLWRIKKYLGAYLAIVGSPHAIIFTDTIGENIPYVRWAVCSGLSSFGVEMDYKKNDAAKHLPIDVASDKSSVKILVIETNEELAIARRSEAALKRQKGTEDEFTKFDSI